MKTVEQRLLDRTVENTEVTSPHADTPCWICNYGIANGKDAPQMWVGGRAEKVSRVAYWIWVAEFDLELQINHHCDNTHCVNPGHLWAGTHQENMDDMVKKERQHTPTGDLNGSRLYPERMSRGDIHSKIMKKVAKRGEGHYLRISPEKIRRGVQMKWAKLTEEHVRYIRMWAGEGFLQRKIGDSFGVSQSQVSSIIRRETWKHVV